MGRCGGLCAKDIMQSEITVDNHEEKLGEERDWRAGDLLGNCYMVQTRDINSLH